jgi:hypothetical protein
MTEQQVSTAPFFGRTAWSRRAETPLRASLRTESGSAAVLLTVTVAALAWANFGSSSYDRVATAHHVDPGCYCRYSSTCMVGRTSAPSGSAPASRRA